jgi:hypothetical protein
MGPKNTVTPAAIVAAFGKAGCARAGGTAMKPLTAPTRLPVFVRWTARIPTVTAQRSRLMISIPNWTSSTKTIGLVIDDENVGAQFVPPIVLCGIMFAAA